MSSDLNVIPWRDPVVDENGLDPRSLYFEWCWLPLVGPTSAWAYLRLNTMFTGDPALGLPPSPNGFDINLDYLARSVGLRQGGDAQAFRRILARLIRFELARDDDGVLSVRRRVPWLIRKQLAGLPTELQQFHVMLLERHDDQRLAP